MFGEVKKPSLPKLKPRPVPKIVDVVGIGGFGHVAPTPNTCYNKLLMQYYRRERLWAQQKEDALKEYMRQEGMYVKYSKHFERQSYRRTLMDKIKKKSQGSDAQLEERRKEISELIAKEERELIQEVVDVAQKVSEEKTLEKIEKVKRIREEKEAERLAFVKDMRLQQKLQRCAEYRPLLAHQRLKESKAVQLLQLKEKQSQKESERELDKMWHEIKLKEKQAMEEREEQDRMKELKQKNEFKFFFDLQMKAAEARNEIKRQQSLEERERLDKLRKDIQEEERVAWQEKIKRRNEQVALVNAQAKQRKDMLKSQTHDELKIQQAYDKLADDELEKERLSLKQKVSTAYQDMLLFKQYLADQEQARIEEAKKMDAVVNENMRQIQRKQDEEKCNAEMKRKELLETVLKERAEQLQYHQKQVEEQMKKTETENQMIRSTMEMNDKLREERKRQKFLAQIAYREDLKRQMEYNRVVKEREREEMRQILESAKTEDKIYNDTVSEVLKGNIKIGEIHPFRQVINKEKCPCPKTLY